MFAYGNREQILNNPEVRRRYIGERFDVGHLLDRRRPASLPHPHPVEAPPSEPVVALPERQREREREREPLERNAFGSPDQTISTDAFIGQLEEYTIEYSETPPLDDERDEIDRNLSQSNEEDWD